MRDLDLAYGALLVKQAPILHYFNYYTGDAIPPLVAARLRDIYQDGLIQVNENWCDVVINATADRIALQSLTGPNRATTRALEKIVQSTGLLIEGDDAHEHALIAGEAFIIAWRDLDTGEFEAYTQAPAMCTAIYHPASPNKMRLAAKMYPGDDQTIRVVLYYPERIEEWAAPMRDGMLPDTSKGFTLIDTQVNPFDTIPVFHFRASRRRIASDLKNVIPIQNGINILLTNMIVASEFGAMPMKFVITNATIPKRLKISPGQVWELPAGDGMGQQTSAGEFAAGDMSNYLNPIEHLIEAASAITRTPRHYFTRGGNPPSGEALRSMEAPLVAKVKDRIVRFDPVWRSLGAFLLRLDGYAIRPEAVKATWADPETIQPMMAAQTELIEAQAKAAKIAVGVSNNQALTELGYTPDQIMVFNTPPAATETRKDDPAV